MSDAYGRTSRGMLENILMRIDLLERRSRRSRPLQGTGSPEGIVSARVGTLYLRTDGTPGSILYAKLTGTGPTGWSAV